MLSHGCGAKLDDVEVVNHQYGAVGVGVDWQSGRCH